MTPAPRLALTLPADAESLSALLDAIEAFGAEHALPAATVARLGVLADEIASNIVNHAAGARVMQVTLTLAQGILALEVADDGPAFDPLSGPAPDTAAALEERMPGGLGLHLLRQISRSIAWRREGGRNILTLTLAAAAE